MSSYIQSTLNPKTDEYEDAFWVDDYFGKHHYGVIFKDGTLLDPWDKYEFVHQKFVTTGEMPSLTWDDYPERAKHRLYPLKKDK